MKYILESGAKYGFGGTIHNFDRLEVYNYAVNSKTRLYYPTSIKTFKYSSPFAKFDLGHTGEVYYPSFFYPNNNNIVPTVIDFAHEDFLFTEDSYKTLVDLQE